MNPFRLRVMLAAAVIFVLSTAPLPAATETLSNGRFEDMIVYQPRGEARRVLFLLNGSLSVNELDTLATSLANDATLVVRIDVRRLLATLQDPDTGCVDLGADFEGLSHFIQAHYRLPAYHAPYFAGFGEGAAAAYAVIAEAPTSTYAGLLAWDFCPTLAIRTPLCRGDDLHTADHSVSAGLAASASIELLPLTRIHTPLVVQPSQAACDARVAQSFVHRLPISNLVAIRGAVRDDAAIHESLGQLFALAAPARSPTAETADLPLVEVIPAESAAAALFAILISGDGGWTGLDKDVAAALATRRIPVIGWDSLRYFWKPRTPEELAMDGERVIRHYQDRWPHARVMLLGYSQGANVMPFLVSRLPPTIRERLALVALTGLEDNADFEFHFANWLGNNDRGLPVLPELAKLRGLRIACIYGSDETDSTCPKAGDKVQPVALPGGHHFNGDYAAVADAILRASADAANGAP